MLLLDLVLPQRCPACAAPAAPAAAGWCAVCASDAAALLLPGHGFARLSDSVAAVGQYAYSGAVADAVRGMKLQGRWAAAGPLGIQLRRELNLPPWPRTWVPSTRRRRRDRGFELPQLLAGSDAMCLLRRISERPDQTSLSAQERRASPAGAFASVRSVPREVVLVDDVRTTGATALAAAAALHVGGARRVLIATLAVGGEAARASSGSATAVRPG